VVRGLGTVCLDLFGVQREAAIPGSSCLSQVAQLESD
jgi:hypothetical protein